ncbi:MAG: hypothetical protein AAGL98_00650 [Planctomycetota bacterium]
MMKKIFTVVLMCVPGTGLVGVALPSAAQNSSAPAILQYFESRWDTIEERTIDSFYAGYGGMWIPPTGRADSGGLSVGYDQFDRFDLGTPRNETLYGTETSLKALTHQADKAGVAVYADLILNHNGFSDINRPGFRAQGDYPGFVLRTDDLIDGDFHSSFAGGRLEGRLSGLIDIDHTTNLQFIRHPVEAGNPQNIPAGTVWDRPDPDNARFYPDQDLGGPTVNNPDLFGNPTATLYDFNTDQPRGGDAVADNGLGLMLRHARWMIQEVGIDGFRLDATQHYEPFVLEFLDQAVHDAAPRRLDGSHSRTFSFGETLTGDQNLIQQYVQNVDRGLSTVGGNRDALDFPLFFAMRDNLTGNGLANDWRNIKNAAFDGNDGFANDGSQGVAFVNSHDDNGAFLSNVAHAYIMMRPGNAIAYFNAKEFGEGRDFPKDGRGDALGGQFGDTITTLVDIRNTHGRGNYLDRTPTGDERETLIYERENAALVVLSNRLDGGFDARTVQTGFAPGTHLVELTGNAADSTIDPFNDFPEVVTVNADGTVNLNVLRNVSPTDGNIGGVQHNNGYLIYGVAGPQGQLSLSNVDSVLAGDTGTTLLENATVRLNDVDVIKADAFDLTLNTNAVNLLGNSALRDRHADGDAAFFKINGGLDGNGNGAVDIVNGDILYGFENFTDVNDPGFFNASGDGQYSQTLDTTQLEEGYNFLTVRAFRHRNANTFTDGDPSTAGDGGPAVYEDFKRAIYVDRLKPETELAKLVPFSSDGHNIDFRARSTDGTAEEMFFFLNLDDDLTDAQINGLLGGGSTTTQIDRDLFQRGYFDVQAGNHKLTVVTREITGTTNVQHLAGIDIDNGNGLGIGDINKNNAFNRNDLTFNPLNPGGSSPNFETFLYTSQFSPAADANGDGTVNVYDLLALEDLLDGPGITQDTINAYHEVKSRRGNLNGNGDVDSFDLLFMRDHRGTTDDNTLFTLDLNPDGVIDGVDAELFVTGFLDEITGDLTRDGVIDLFDAEALVLALTDRNAYQTQYSIDALVTADVNRDFVFNLSDIEPFLALYGDYAGEAAAVIAAIPEPGSAALLGLLICGLLRQRCLQHSW